MKIKEAQKQRRDFSNDILNSPIACVIFGIVAIILGVAAFILPQRKNAPVPITEAKEYSGYFEKCRSSRNYFSVCMTDGTEYSLYHHTLRNDTKEAIKSIEKGTPISVRVHPKNDCVVELIAGTDELLSFDKTQKDIAEYSNGYVILGIVVSVAGLYLMFWSVIVKKNKEKEKERQSKHSKMRDENGYTVPLRDADMSKKGKVFLMAKASGMTILYRRVGHVNELIIDDVVYDEIKGVFEFDHKLTARLKDHTVVAGLKDMTSYIKLDGKRIKTNRRIV